MKILKEIFIILIKAATLALIAAFILKVLNFNVSNILKQ
jgi:hypothetical protein